MPQEELAVIQKTYDLTKWACEEVARFPRQWRFTLGARIECGLYELLELLIQARYTRQRADLLRRANLALEVLRYRVRLAHELRCLRPNTYEGAGRRMYEIGAMVGGWGRL